MIAVSSAGEFLALLLKPLDQAIETDGSKEHQKELRATALNNLSYPTFVEDSRREDEFYDLAFVFPAHPIDLGKDCEVTEDTGFIGLRSMRNLFSQICVYRTISRSEFEFPRSAYSIAFHDQQPSPPSNSGGLMRMASRTLGLLVPRRRVVGEPLLEMTNNTRERQQRAEADAGNLSPPLIAVGSDEFVGGGVDSLSSFYRLNSILEQSARCRWLPVDVHLIVRSVFVECLQKLGAHTSTTIVASKVVVKVRLSETACQQAAEQLEYHLCLSPTLKRAGRDNYSIYDRALPRDRWSLYDGLSRVIKTPTENPDGSLFRDIDRMRLLILQIQAHFNLGVMSSDFELCEKESSRKTLFLTPCLLEYFPLHRIHLQQYFCDSGLSLTTKIQDRLDEDLRCNYYGEEIAAYFLWTKFLLWSLLGPIIYGSVHSIVKIAALSYKPEFANIAMLESALSLCHVIYLSVWAEWIVSQWVLGRSQRLKRPSMNWSSGNVADTSPRPYRRSSSSDLNHNTRIAKDFERSDYEFDYYKITKEGEYLKYEDPKNRRRRKNLSRLLTVWLYLSLTTCLVLTFYARASTEAEVISMAGESGAETLNPKPNGAATSPAHRAWSEIIRSMIMPLLSRVQILNYLQTAIIMFFDKLWVMMVPKILSLENHRLAHDYRYSLVQKSYYFKFLNHFLPLLYSALITQSHIAFQNQLIIQVVSLIMTDFVGVFQVIFKQLRDWRGSSLKQASAMAIQCKMPSYDLAELTQYFIDIILQLTHVLFFAPICPIISIFAALRCLLQILLHNYKLALLYKRLITHDYPRSLDAALGIIINASTPLALSLLLYSNQLHTFKQKLIAFVILQNVLLGFKMAVRYALR